MVITRKLPNSNIGRQKALSLAKAKQDSLPLGSLVLNPTTVTRLNDAVTGYDTALNSVAVAQANLSSNTPVKDTAISNSRMYTSHFIQVFNLGVARGKYPAAHRAFYMLDVSSSAVPDLGTEADVLLWGQRLIEGDASRITAGGLPMANPDIAEVTTQRTTAGTAFTTQNTLTETLDLKQEIVEQVNPEADSLIKRIWDEVEAYYGEEETESKRQNARLWGVVYVSEGPAALLSGLVKNAAGNALEGATVTVAQTGASATTNNEGRYTVSTTVIGTVTLEAEYPGFNKVNTELEIAKHDDEVEINVADLVIS